MNLFSIHTGYFKLDGGAMFGVVPKSLWSKTNPPDDNNMCTWALRCLLIEDSGKLILIDNGIGNKQDEKFLSRYYLHGNETLETSLKHAGFSKEDVTDMFLSHLHFDHCGGSIIYNEDRSKLKTNFKNARYWSNAEHWKWATEPNAREKASFLHENILPIKESGQLNLIDGPSEPKEGSQLGSNISILFVNGHTGAMMLPHVKYKDRVVVFVSDLIPSSSHIPLPFIMGYDIRPLMTLSEKQKLLDRAATENWVLFFEHDPDTECCTVHKTDKGVRIKERFSLAEL